jgi:hypothetical protein
VIGSWIVGAVVMPVHAVRQEGLGARAIPFIVLFVAQWFLQFVGAMGGLAGNFGLHRARTAGTFIRCSASSR